MKPAAFASAFAQVASALQAAVTAADKGAECFSFTSAPVAFVEHKDIAVASHLGPILPHRLVCNAHTSERAFS